MKIPLSFLLCLLVGLLAVSAQTADDNKKHKTTTTTTVAPPPTVPSTTTTPQPTTPSSTTPPPTTPSTPTPPPTTPSTTTPQPTTPTPTTPTPAPTTPTPAPTTPTTAEPTSAPTTPAPAPSTTVAPVNKEWVVEDPMTHHACIMATMGVTFNLHTPNVSAEMKIDPSSARAEGGNCTWNTSEVLRLVWENNSSMDIVFSQKDKKNYFISALNVSLAYNASGVMKMASFSSQNLTLFMANINSSYACDSAEFPQLKSNNDTEHLDIKVAHLQVEAFRSHINSTSFSSAHYCPGEVPDVVPLVVGICLAGLVLVVVVAYLIGRRRSQASGYHSM